MGIFPFKKQWHIAAKFNLLTIMLILATSVGICLFVLRLETTNSYRDLLNHGTTIANTTAKNCEFGIYTEDQASLLPVLESLSTDPAIAYVSVMNRQRRVLASRVFKGSGEQPELAAPISDSSAAAVHRDLIDERDGRRYIEVLSPVTSVGGNDIADVLLGNHAGAREPVVIGYLRLGLTQEGLQKRLRQMLVSITLFTSIFVVVGIGLTIFLTRKITAPLERLTTATRDVADGKFDSRVEIHSNDEISILARSFDHMQDRLRTYHEQVEERTTELTATKETLQKIIDSSSAVIFAKDLNSKYIFINSVYEKLFHVSKNDIIGKTDYDIFPRDAAYAFRETDLQALKANMPIEVEEAVPQDDGIHTYITQKFLLCDNHNNTYAICGMSTDITERKRLEEQAQQTQKLQSIGTLAGGIAHDFNNLLQGVFGYISLAKMTIDNKDKSILALEKAEKALHLSVKLTTQLLTFSKGGKPVKKLINLRTIIENSTNFMLSGSHSDLLLNIPEDLWPVEADEGQIGQVIQNIVLNADQSMQNGGTVTVIAANMSKGDALLPPGLAQGDYVMIAVQDTGVGIPEQYLSKIFDPYFTTKEKGSGLGLATAYSIVKNHEGLLDVRTKPGAGSTFMIYLPTITREVRTASAGKKQELPRSRRAKVLVMDDEEVIRNISSELLCALGHDVDVVKHGQAALEKYQHAIAAGSPFDIVILDLTIRGGMGGVETVQQLLKIDPHVKAVVSSGYSDDAATSNYISKGFKAFLKKPYDVDALRDVLNKILNG